MCKPDWASDACRMRICQQQLSFVLMLDSEISNHVTWEFSQHGGFLFRIGSPGHLSQGTSRSGSSCAPLTYLLGCCVERRGETHKARRRPVYWHKLRASCGVADGGQKKPCEGCCHSGIYHQSSQKVAQDHIQEACTQGYQGDQEVCNQAHENL